LAIGASNVPDESTHPLVDDESPVREMLSLYFRNKGYDVNSVATGGEAMEAADHERFNAAVVEP